MKGCCGSIIQCVLIITNIIFLIIGIVITALGIILKVGLQILLKSDNVGFKELEPLLDLSSLDTIAIVFIVVGVFIFILSIFGLCGACCTNRFLLILYEICIIIIFLAHLIGIIVVAVKLPDLEDLFNKKMDEFVAEINSYNTLPKELPPNLNDQCKALKFISELFECCGANGPSDFKDQNIVTDCCDGSYAVGCKTQVIDFIKDKSNLFIIIPNSIIIAFEFLIVVITAVLIVKITREIRDRKNYAPTVYYKR